MPRRRNKREEQVLAIDRIQRLVSLAERSIPAHPSRSDRYVSLARRIAMRYQVSLPTDLRRRVCRSCDGLLVPSRTARVRVASGRVIVTCLRCGAIKRYPYGPPKVPK